MRIFAAEIDHRMAGQKFNEMFRHANRPDARPAAAVRNAKRLVQIQMADVRADEAGRSQDRPARSCSRRPCKPVRRSRG